MYPVNPFKTRNIIRGTLANSEDQDDDAAFHLGLHFLFSLNQSSEKEFQYFLGQDKDSLCT